MAKDSAKTRRGLIAAADKLFYGEGIRATGVDAIAAAAGVTKRTLYYHFDCKDDLVAAYLDGRDLPTLGRYQALIKDPTQSAGEQVRTIFAHLAENAKDRHWRGCSFVRAAVEFVDMPGHPARVIAARHKKRFEDWLVQILSADQFGEAASLARQIMILFDGAVTQILIHRDPSYALSAGDAAAALLKGDRRKSRLGRSVSSR
jgi:AcrR family transcriptional regulator